MKDLIMLFDLDVIFVPHTYPLYFMSRHNNVDSELLKIYATKFPVNTYKHCSGNTLLNVASKTGNDAMVEVLLDEPGADVSTIDKVAFARYMSNPASAIAKQINKLMHSQEFVAEDTESSAPKSEESPTQDVFTVGFLKKLTGDDTVYCRPLTKPGYAIGKSESTSSELKSVSSISSYVSAMVKAITSNSVLVVRELLHWRFWEALEKEDPDMCLALSEEIADWVIQNLRNGDPRSSIQNLRNGDPRSSIQNLRNGDPRSSIQQNISIESLLPNTDEYLCNIHLEILFRMLFRKSLATEKCEAARFLYFYESDAAFNEEHESLEELQLLCYYLELIAESGRDDILG
jgi:hypothetical protein